MYRKSKLRTPTPLAVDRALNTLLEGYYPPPPGVSDNPNAVFTRRHDDTDGKRGPEQEVSLTFTPDGDAWLMLPGYDSLRFRAPMGGGRSPRVHRALILLAEAIRRDSEQYPQGEQENRPKGAVSFYALKRGEA